jgi:hypothetical protein
MYTTMHLPIAKRFRRRRPARAVTVTELLATCVAFGLGLMILGPSLHAVGGRSRSGICLSNLMALGRAIHEYAEQSAGTLPGPVHPALSHDMDESQPEWIRQRHLPSLLRQTLGADVLPERVITCPTMGIINPDRNWPVFYETTGRNVMPFHYALNNVGPNSETGGPVSGVRTTDPPCYFGYASWSPVEPTTLELEHRYRPAQLGAVDNPDREWMIADAWYRKRANAMWPELQQEGPYQWSWSGEALSNFAPHFRRGPHAYRYSADRDLSSSRIRQAKADGVTNTLYFDAHAGGAVSRTLVVSGFEILYGFRGTVNPNTPLMDAMVWR